MVGDHQVSLEYLAAVCRDVIGQSPGPNQWHLHEAFGNQGLLGLIIHYRKDLEP